MSAPAAGARRSRARAAVPVVVRRAAASIALALSAAACAGGDSDSAAAGSAPPARARVGSAAPDYSARTIAGDSVSLLGMRGEVVLLNIWATWCHPCRTEIPELQSLYELHRGRGLQVVGVSVDAASEDSAVADFAREYGMTYPLWRDPDGRVSTVFAAVGVPATYLMDRDGILRWSHLGPVAATDSVLGKVLAEALAASGE